MLTGKLLLSVNNGLNFHQTHEGAAEAACIGIAEEFCDIGKPPGGVREQAASDAQANLRKHFAVTCAHAAKMALQRARADLEGASGTIEGCVTVSQRRDNGRAHRLG
jgi:hypothetical protein